MLVLEEFTSWFLEEEFFVYWVFGEDGSTSSAEELRVVSSEDELLVTSSEEVRVSVFGAEELSSPQAANKIDAASTKSFFKVFSLFELFPVQI